MYTEPSTVHYTAVSLGEDRTVPASEQKTDEKSWGDEEEEGLDSALTSLGLDFGGGGGGGGGGGSPLGLFFLVGQHFFTLLPSPPPPSSSRLFGIFHMLLRAAYVPSSFAGAFEKR